VKTAISIPDLTFERVTRRAKDLGMNRSELFVRAVEVYLDELDAQSRTAEINAALARLGDRPALDEDLVAFNRARLATLDDAW
jgi:metal-responsive CopG/Arc/MetJ family transcriptional regulator